MTHAFNAENGISATIRRLRGGIAHRRARAEVFRRTVAELTVMSDRELADMGLARADIGRVARDEAAKA